MVNTDSLTDKEIEYIERAMIFRNIKDEKTMKCFSWRAKIQCNIFEKTANQDEILQYGRIRDMENLITLLGGYIPESIVEYLEIAPICDEIEKTFLLKAMLEISMHEIEDTFSFDCLKKLFKDDYEQDLNDPFIKKLIKELQNDYIEEQKYERMYEIIENLKFENLNDKTIVEFLMLLFKSLNNESGKKMYYKIEQIDKKMVVYLILRYSSKLSINFEDDISNKKI